MARKREKEKLNDSKKKEKVTSEQEQRLASRETEKIELKEENQEGLLVLIKTSEEIKMEQDHDANINLIDFNGILTVKNPSSLDRIWNIEIKLKNIENTTLESNIINIKELGTNEDNNSYSQNFQLAKEVKKRLLVKEYINTSPNADDYLNFKDIETDLNSLKNKSITVEQKEEGKKAILAIEEKKETEKKSEKVERTEPIVEAETEMKLEEKALVEEDLKEKKTEFETEEKMETIPPENGEKQVKEWFEQMKSQRKEETDLDEEKREKPNEKEEESENISEDGGINAANFTLESLGLSINKANNVKFVIAMLNSLEKPIHNVKLVKNIPIEFGSLTIASASIGSAKIEENKLIWTIEDLPADNCVFLKFSADINVKSLETIRSGPIEVVYTASSSFVEGIEIEKFEALTRNKFYVDMIERDEAPSLWDCKLVFENPSEFKMELCSVNVHSPENKTINYVNIDKDNIPKLSAGGQWNSNIWQYECIDYPAFVKNLDFRVMPMFKTEVKGFIKIVEAQFVLAIIGGEVVYSLAEPTKVLLREKIEENVIVIPSYKEANINAVLKVVNNGSASLNEVIVEHKYFSEIFLPPKREEVKLSLNGKEFDLDPTNVIIDENFPKKLTVVIKDLRKSPLGIFEPNSIIEVSHPIHIRNPPRDAKLEPEITYRANTYPLGQEIIYLPEPDKIPKIQVIHIRRKYKVGKEINPIGEVGNYEIILYFENIGEFTLEEFMLIDKVPSNFEYGEFSTDPEITSDEGTKFLKWRIKSIEEGKTLEFKYKMRGKGQYHPSEAQVAF